MLALAAGIPTAVVLRERALGRENAAAALQVARTAIADNLATKSRNVRQADPGLSLRLATTAVGLKPDDNTRANLVAAIVTGYAGELPAGKDIWAARYRPDGTAVVLVARTRH